MNDNTTDLDQTDEETLTCDVSDEALEAAAGTERGVSTPHCYTVVSTVVPHYCC
jgi:hypothetical protein